MRDPDLDRHIHQIYEAVASPGSWHECLEEIACAVKKKSRMKELDVPCLGSTIAGFKSSFSSDTTKAFAVENNELWEPSLSTSNPPKRKAVHQLAPSSDYLNKLLPHIKRALKLNRQLLNSNFSQQLNQQVLEHLDYAVLFADSSGKVVSKNSLADRLFLGRDLSQIFKETLLASDAINDIDCKAAIASVCRTSSGLKSPASIPILVKVSNETEEQTFLLEVERFEQHAEPGFAQIVNGWKDALAMISIRELSQRDISIPKKLEALYQLSSTEIDIAIQLADGFSPKEIADTRNRSIETIRTQIKQVIGKVGLKSSTKLVALVNQLST